MTTHRTSDGVLPVTGRPVDRDVASDPTDVVWRDGVPFAPTDEVMAGVERLIARDAELLRRLAE